MGGSVAQIISLSVVGLVVLAFVLLAWKDVMLLFIRPGRGMGRGLGRIWAVARVTLAECRAGRAWALPLLWLAGVLLLIWMVRPYDESERIGLYLRVLLLAQEWLLLVMVWVMACLSMPRERERKIVVTNASKPLSRLEIYLGKITGFAVMTLMLLAVMGAASWVILQVSDRTIRVRAASEYTLAESDFKEALEKRRQAMQAEGAAATNPELSKPLVVPSERLKRLSEEGSLFAYNYITAIPKTGFSIAGDVDFTQSLPMRLMRGGSQQKAVYTLGAGGGKYGIIAPPGSIAAPVGARPFFHFQYGVFQYTATRPDKVEIQVTARLQKNPLREQQKLLTLNNGGVAEWEPDRPDELFSMIDPVLGVIDRGPIEIEVQCITSGVMLHVSDGRDVDHIDVAVVPLRSDMRTWAVQEPNPRIVGFERRDKQQIAGPNPKETNILANVPLTEMAIYQFSGSALRGLPVDQHGNFTLAMNLDVEKQGNFELDTDAVIRAYNAEAPANAVLVSTRIIEKRITQVSLPGTLLGTDPNKRRDLFIYVMCQTPSHWIGLDETSVRIELPPSPFVLNLFKSEMVLFCEMLLLIVICVTCSLRLGWPVAMLASAVCVLLGFCWPFIADLSQANGLAALGFRQISKPSTGERLADSLVAVSYYLLNLFVSILPDFTRFDALGYIVDLRNIPVLLVLVDLGLVALFTLPFVALGYIMIRKQELG